jgi:hypothetical protein
MVNRLNEGMNRCTTGVKCDAGCINRCDGKKDCCEVSLKHNLQIFGISVRPAIPQRK